MPFLAKFVPALESSRSTRYGGWCSLCEDERENGRIAVKDSAGCPGKSWRIKPSVGSSLFHSGLFGVTSLAVCFHQADNVTQYAPVHFVAIDIRHAARYGCQRCVQRCTLHLVWARLLKSMEWRYSCERSSIRACPPNDPKMALLSNQPIIVRNRDGCDTWRGIRYWTYAISWYMSCLI